MKFHRGAAAAFCFLAASTATATVVSAGVREDFLKLIERPHVALSPEITPLADVGSLQQFHFTYASDAQQRVPGILLKRKDLPAGRRPVVIALHGTGGTKDGEVPFLKKLAERGFIAVAIDGRYHGERCKEGKGTADYQAAIHSAFAHPGEHPFYYDTVWDVMRLIDYLQTRDDVDGDHVGLYGVSKGGIETYLAAAADPRIAAAVPCIGLQSFKWALDHDAWKPRIATIPGAFAAAAKDRDVASPTSEFVHEFYSRVAPGLDGEFDGPAMVAITAPRPLFAINGDSDDKTPLPGLQLCVDAATAAYHAAGVDDHFVERVQPHTGHQVTAESEAAAIEWFVRFLKPMTPATSPSAGR